MKKVKGISNPLTIIGIFAIMTESICAVVLPFLDSELQKYFIFFVILFPLLIGSAFFLTLNFNPKVLYAPSDFSDEKNFMALLEMGDKIEELKSNNPELEEQFLPIESTYQKVFLRQKSPMYKANTESIYEVFHYLKMNKNEKISIREIVDNTNMPFEAVASALSLLLMEAIVYTTPDENDEQKWVYRNRY